VKRKSLHRHCNAYVHRAGCRVLAMYADWRHDRDECTCSVRGVVVGRDQQLDRRGCSNIEHFHQKDPDGPGLLYCADPKCPGQSNGGRMLITARKVPVGAAMFRLDDLHHCRPLSERRWKREEGVQVLGTPGLGAPVIPIHRWVEEVR
jgi:hypothetical protein